jgi:hypothetical protein
LTFAVTCVLEPALEAQVGAVEIEVGALLHIGLHVGGYDVQGKAACNADAGASRP